MSKAWSLAWTTSTRSSPISRNAASGSRAISADTVRVSGLAVTIEDSDKGKRVAVSPGVAVSPRGQLIRVAPKQCAVLNEWLKGAVKKDIPAGTTTLPVYVVLCYRDCPTDEVPILGEPCRTEEESMAPSRIVDDFRLELRLDPPPQREEDAVRDFVAWLRQIEIVDFAADPQDLKNFLDAIRAAAQELPSPIDFLYGSPPSDLFIPRSEVCEWLRAAFGLWVTELRPLWQSAVSACGRTSANRTMKSACCWRKWMFLFCHPALIGRSIQRARL